MRKESRQTASTAAAGETLLAWTSGAEHLRRLTHNELWSLAAHVGENTLFARLIKAKEFLQHDPEMFALYASLGIVTLCATVIAFVLPVTLPPLLLPCVSLVIGALAGRALGCFHKRR